MKQLIIAILICAFAGAKTYAQPFETSDATTPKWYFIQVKGTGDNAGKVVTEEDGKAIGRSVAGLADRAKQLWRIETTNNASQWVIINKYSGKKLDVSYDADLGERIAVVSETPATEWTTKLIAGNYCWLRIVKQPSGGVSGAGYLTQSGSSLHSALYFTKTDANNPDDNAQFQFVSIDAPVLSDNYGTVWFAIRNAQNGGTDKCLTEIETTENIKFSMQDFASTNRRQQWKIVSNPGQNGSVNFVNRETGHLISSTPVYDLSYYYVQYAGSEGAGWSIDELGNNQYEVRTGPAAAGNYWYAATDGQPTAMYTKGASLNTGFAWKFQFCDEEILTAIEAPQQDRIRVYVQDRRIYVEGADQYRVYTVYGTTVNANGQLPVGVYLVTTKNKTTKILVK
jgi:hypothetical protein